MLHNRARRRALHQPHRAPCHPVCLLRRWKERLGAAESCGICVCVSRSEGRRVGGCSPASPYGRPSSAWLRSFPSSLRTCCCIQYIRDGFSLAAFRPAWPRWHARSADYVVARSSADSSTKRIRRAAATLRLHVYGARLWNADSAQCRRHAGRSNPAAFAQASRERVCYNFTTSGEACAVVVRNITCRKSASQNG
jgi:hypothetical protein